MSVYAIVKDDLVENIVEADEPAILGAFFPAADDIVEATGQTGYPFVGYPIIGGRFQPAAPYASWEWDAESWSWVAPVPYPEGGNGYTWDEDTLGWAEIPTSPDR